MTHFAPFIFTRDTRAAGDQSRADERTPSARSEASRPTLFDPFTYHRSAPAALGQPDANAGSHSPAKARTTGRTLFSWVAWLGFATGAFGMPAAIWAWLS